MPAVFAFFMKSTSMYKTASGSCTLNAAEPKPSQERHRKTEGGACMGWLALCVYIVVEGFLKVFSRPKKKSRKGEERT